MGRDGVSSKLKFHRKVNCVIFRVKFDTTQNARKVLHTRTSTAKNRKKERKKEEDKCREHQLFWEEEEEEAPALEVF